MLGVLEIFDAGQQHAGVADDGAAGFDQDFLGAIPAARATIGRDTHAVRRLFVAVTDAEAAAEVEVADR